MAETFAKNETARIEAFSDGVFAIAITLLILTVKVPKASELGEGGLGAALLAQWPQYLAFVTSFATILAKWINPGFSLISREVIIPCCTGTVWSFCW